MFDTTSKFSDDLQIDKNISLQAGGVAWLGLFWGRLEAVLLGESINDHKKFPTNPNSYSYTNIKMYPPNMQHMEIKEKSVTVAILRFSFAASLLSSCAGFILLWFPSDMAIPVYLTLHCGVRNIYISTETYLFH